MRRQIIHDSMTDTDGKWHRLVVETQDGPHPPTSVYGIWAPVDVPAVVAFDGRLFLNFEEVTTEVLRAVEVKDVVNREI